MNTEGGPRWDNDQRGTGVGDAKRLLEGALQLAEALGRPGWVAEQPETHLMPNITAWIAAISTRLELVSTALGTDGSLEVEVRWRGRHGDVRGVRAAVFELIGQVAKSATYVRQRPVGPAELAAQAADVELFEVATGDLEGDTPFASHGHVVLIRVVRVTRGP